MKLSVLKAPSKMAVTCQGEDVRALLLQEEVAVTHLLALCAEKLPA